MYTVRKQKYDTALFTHYTWLPNIIEAKQLPTIIIWYETRILKVHSGIRMGRNSWIFRHQELKKQRYFIVNHQIIICTSDFKRSKLYTLFCQNYNSQKYYSNFHFSLVYCAWSIRTYAHSLYMIGTHHNVHEPPKLYERPL